jgi:hypothetical protein
MLTMWPAFTRLFGIRPWELELLTPAELGQYVRFCREYLAAIAARS